MKIKLPKNYELSGPYFNYSAPYGRVLESLNRREWFLSRHKVPEKELKQRPKEIADHYRKHGDTIGHVERFDNQKRRYILPQTHPIIEFPSLQKAIDYLIKNHRKISYCS